MKRKVGRIVAAISTVLLTSTAYSEQTEDQCVEPDHFLSYEFLELPTVDLPDGPVELQDQFLGGITAFTLDDPVRLLNPATKYHKGKIIRPEQPGTHYLAVEVFPEDAIFTVGDVFVFNQFGTHTFEVDDIDVEGLQLLVPSVKKACPSGNCIAACDDCFPEGDHYLCYPLDEDEEECRDNPRFDDQFVKNRTVDSLIPTRLCNPVDKTFNGITHIANHEETNHLLCYRANEKIIPPRLVTLLNQFGEQKGVVRVNDEICVPSTTIFQEFPTLTNGK